jgi:glutathionylspermidine synthase
MRAGNRVDDFDDIRRSMALHHFKWDAQVGDTDALASFPLLISKSEWTELASMAESLTREMISAEMRIADDDLASNLLGVPRAIRPLLRRLTDEATPSLGRIVRFDFHRTPNGWRISEANSDVPGGFTEASSFTSMMAHAYGNAMTGDPARAWLDAISNRAQNVALLVAPGWLEDSQVVAFLERGLRDRECAPQVVAPHQIRWSEGFAHLEDLRLDAIVRFHQAEWLARLSSSCDWHPFFVGGKTLVGNPGIAITSESKRFSLACEALDLSMPTWRALLPETCDPRHVAWHRDDDWILKGAFGNTGENVRIRSQLTKLAWTRAALSARLQPSKWVAQRRFESTSIDTPDGPRHVCVGVYTIDGVAAGAYARLSSRAMIDFAAVDVAVLLEDA